MEDWESPAQMRFRHLLEILAHRFEGELVNNKNATELRARAVQEVGRYFSFSVWKAKSKSKAKSKDANEIEEGIVRSLMDCLPSRWTSSTEKHNALLTEMKKLISTKAGRQDEVCLLAEQLKGTPYLAFSVAHTGGDVALPAVRADEQDLHASSKLASCLSGFNLIVPLCALDICDLEGVLKPVAYREEMTWPFKVRKESIHPQKVKQDPAEKGVVRAPDVLQEPPDDFEEDGGADNSAPQLSDGKLPQAKDKDFIRGTYNVRSDMGFFVVPGSIEDSLKPPFPKFALPAFIVESCSHRREIDRYKLLSQGTSLGWGLFYARPAPTTRDQEFHGLMPFFGMALYGSHSAMVERYIVAPLHGGPDDGVYTLPDRAGPINEGLVVSRRVFGCRPLLIANLSVYESQIL